MTQLRRCIRNTAFFMAILTSARAQVEGHGGTASNLVEAALVEASAPTGSAEDAGDSYKKRVVALFPHYAPQQQVSGVIRISGHGSASNPWMRQLLTAWEKDFQRFQPGIRLEY